MKAHPRFAGIGGHHSPIARTDEWLTPPEILAALGPFDLDPCAPINRPWPMAAAHFTIADDGLMKPWAGRIWLNPPYSNPQLQRWLARMAAHNFGTALIFARTETDAFFSHVWDRAAGLLFIRGRLNFYDVAGRRAKANSGAPSVLCAYGFEDADRLASCGIDGQFVPLQLPRMIAIAALAGTWRDALVDFFARKGGAIRLADLYREFAGHAKAKRNPNFDAKIRQVLQQGPFKRVARGQWELDLA